MVRSGLVTKGVRSNFAGPFNLTVSGGTCAAITGPSGSSESLLLRRFPMKFSMPPTGEKLVAAMERAGVEFIPENGGGAGMRMKKRGKRPL
jgi:alpha-D-ribose 1-methylphosphonate 5-triphosphate synthase subunit PhnL